MTAKSIKTIFGSIWFEVQCKHLSLFKYKMYGRTNCYKYFNKKLYKSLKLPYSLPLDKSNRCEIGDLI